MFHSVGKDRQAVVWTVEMMYVRVGAAEDLDDFLGGESECGSDVLIATPQVDIFEIAIKLVNPGTDSRKVNMSGKFPSAFCTERGTSQRQLDTAAGELTGIDLGL